jgi:hypothetical protein
MTERISAEIAIIGGGVIGLATAIRLRSDGREVTIIEPNPPSSSAAYGSAGTIADYATIPVGTPAVLRNLPSLLFDRDSPLSIRQAALPALMPDSTSLSLSRGWVRWRLRWSRGFARTTFHPCRRLRDEHTILSTPVAWKPETHHPF